MPNLFKSQPICNRLHLFAANYFERLIQEIERVGQPIPEFRPFIPKIDADIRKGEAAAKSGNKNAMLESLASGIQDAKAVASTLKSIPKIQKLDQRAPGIINKVSSQIKQGAKAPGYVNKMAGYFNRKVKEGAKHA